MAYQSESLIAHAREVREASGTSQRALSERAGLTQSHISQIESGKMEPGLAAVHQHVLHDQGIREFRDGAPTLRRVKPGEDEVREIV